MLQCRDCDPCCGDLSAGLGFPSGYNPVDLPWWDGTQDSADFAGILIENIEGLEPGNFARPVVETSGVGAVIGQGRQTAPTVVVTGLLLAASCCAQEFGLQWLRKALRSPCSGSLNCTGEDLVFLSCEPKTPDLDCPENADFDFEAWLDPYFRTLKGVALVDGPHVVERIARACYQCSDCPIYRVQFTLAAAKPFVFLEPLAVLTSASLVCNDGVGDCIVWDTDDTCTDETVCGTPVDCALDPDCESTVEPPTVPAISNPCVDECITVGSCSVCADIPAGTFPSNGEGTLIVQVYAGSSEMRRVKLQVWFNPLDLDVTDLDECDVCSELNISYIGAGSTLTIDGTTQTASIDCVGGATVRANPFIASATGSPSFSYPVMEGCAGQYTVCVTTGPGAAIDSFVTIQAVGRES